MEETEGTPETLATEPVMSTGAMAERMLTHLQRTLQHLRDHKPTLRGEETRAWAVTITEMEKVVAYFQTYVVR